MPVVLSRDEVGAVMKQVTGQVWIIVVLLYGAGLRIQECLELRVKDIDFDRHQIVVRRAKGQQDRRTMLPVAARERLQAHLKEVKRQHEHDLAQGAGRVILPFALDRKYPNASTDWAWQFAFAAPQREGDRAQPQARAFVPRQRRPDLPRPVPNLFDPVREGQCLS